MMLWDLTVSVSILVYFVNHQTLLNVSSFYNKLGFLLSGSYTITLVILHAAHPESLEILPLKQLEVNESNK